MASDGRGKREPLLGSTVPRRNSVNVDGASSADGASGGGLVGCWARARARKFVLVKGIAALSCHVGVGVVVYALFSAEDAGHFRCVALPIRVPAAVLY